jgi:hypothetical protein
MRLAAALLVILASVALAACDIRNDGGSGVKPAPTLRPQGAPRTFAMGISSVPPELTTASYEETFALAGQMGDVVLIQRTPPWEELISGQISEDTARATQREKELAQEHGLDIFVAIDPTDPVTGRDQLLGLPPELASAGFGDETVRNAFIAYAQYVAENYRPRYLALGVEINGYQHEHPEDFERFVTLYHEAYRAVKELSPESLVFPTFQFEELQGLLPLDNPFPPQWFLINRFEPQLDLLAVSSFPSLVFASPDDIPADYYGRIQTFTEQPIAISGVGYSSGTERAASERSAEEDQETFLQRTLDSAQQLRVPLLIWFIGQDPAFTSEAPYDKLAHVGLRRQDGSPKAAWDVWLDAARRPLAQTDVMPRATP